MEHTVPVSVAIPAWTRKASLLRVLERIKSCRPAPAEILVHVDGSSPEIMASLAADHPYARVLGSQSLLGPGGGRDVLIRTATYPLVATFDDDSYPEEGDFFAHVVKKFDLFPGMAVLAANVLPEAHPAPCGLERIAEFVGCGCVFRREAYLLTTGFVPRKVAYGMEEADISLQIHSRGGLIIRDANLRVVHDRESPERFNGEFHEEVVINCILLPFLRYPWPLFPLVVWHLMTRLAWETRTGWCKSAIRGLVRAPLVLASHYKHRNPVSARSVLSWYALKRTSPSPHASATKCVDEASAPENK